MYPAKINFAQIQSIHWNLLQNIIFPGYNAIPTLQRRPHVGITAVLPPRKRIWTEGQHCRLEEEQIYSSSSNEGSLCSHTPWKSLFYLRLNFTKKKKIGVLMLLLNWVPCLWLSVLIWCSVCVKWFILRDEGACLDSTELFSLSFQFLCLCAPTSTRCRGDALSSSCLLHPFLAKESLRPYSAMGNLALWSFCNKIK